MKKAFLLMVSAVVYCIFLSSCTKTNSEPATTTLIYVNDSYTPILITSNGTTSTIQPGESISYSGKAGSSNTGTATTSGLNTSNGVVGEIISWPINNTFPASGSLSTSLDVSSTYFFLQINNTSSFTVNAVYANYGLVAQTYDNIEFGTGKYNIGYYQAYSNTDIECTATSGNYWLSYVSLPNTINQIWKLTLTN